MSAGQLVAELEAVVDPAERARAAGRVLEQLAAAQLEAKRVRHEAVLELRARGLSHAEVAAELGLSRGRAHQLAAGVN